MAGVRPPRGVQFAASTREDVANDSKAKGIEGRTSGVTGPAINDGGDDMNAAYHISHYLYVSNYSQSHRRGEQPSQEPRYLLPVTFDLYSLNSSFYDVYNR